MEENTVNMVQWRLEVSPCDKDVQEQSSDVCDHVYVDNFLDGSNSLSSDLSDAFKSTDFTDMTIVCDKREFHCHKFMLAARSE